MTNETVLGGVFIHSENPTELKTWYENALGLQFDGSEEFGAFYQAFFHTAESNKKRYACFSIIRKENIQDTAKDGIRINLRVMDMDSRLQHLSQMGIATKGPEVHPEGKFAWVKDPEGNDLELWEDTMQHA